VGRKNGRIKRPDRVGKHAGKLLHHFWRKPVSSDRDHGLRWKWMLGSCSSTGAISSRALSGEPHEVAGRRLSGARSVELHHREGHRGMRCRY
jgi:hypothetical protein